MNRVSDGHDKSIEFMWVIEQTFSFERDMIRLRVRKLFASLNLGISMPGSQSELMMC